MARSIFRIGRRTLPHNSPVNADARASAVLCLGRAARAGYWER
jgi:hypothetical protein